MHASSSGGDSRRWRTLAITLVAPFMAVFDVFVVNVALPAMQRTLHATFAQLQFVVTGYTLAFAVMLVTGGRLGDIFGRKRLFEIGMLGFALTSAACGFAPSARWLIAARVLQGVCSALMSPQVLSMIQISFDPPERPRALSLYGAVFGLSAVTALTVGGFLIRADILGSSWRVIFLINLPIAGVTLALSRLYVPDSRSAAAPALDPGGIFLVALGLLLLVYPLVQGRDAGWPLWSIACLLSSIPVLIAFFLYETWKTRRDGSALVALGLFSERAFNAGLIVYLVSNLVTAGFFFMLSLHLQLGLGRSPLATGLCVVPTSIGYFIGSVVSAKLGPRFGRGLVVVCLIVRAVSAAATGAVIFAVGSSLTIPMIAPLLFVDGMSAAMTTVPITAITLRNIKSADAGSGSGIFATVGQIASALGIALIGLVFFSALAWRGPAVAEQAATSLRVALTKEAVGPSAVDAAVADFAQCVSDRGSRKDASSTPPSCRSATFETGPPRARGAIAQALDDANARTYAFAYLLGAMVNAVTVLMALVGAKGLPRASSAPPPSAAKAHPPR